MLVRLKRKWTRVDGVQSELKKEAGLRQWRDLNSVLVPYPIFPLLPSTHVSSSTYCHATHCIFTYLCVIIYLPTLECKGFYLFSSILSPHCLEQCHSAGVR